MGWALLSPKCLKCKVTTQHIQMGPGHWQLPRGGSQLLVLKCFPLIACTEKERQVGAGRQGRAFPPLFPGSLLVKASATLGSKSTIWILESGSASRVGNEGGFMCCVVKAPLSQPQPQSHPLSTFPRRTILSFMDVSGPRRRQQ